MSGIPGLDLCPVEGGSDDGIPVPAFNNAIMVIPDSHRHGHCRSIQDFEKLAKLSDGLFGTFYKCRDRRSNAIVTLKKMKMPTEFDHGMPSNILREVSILNHLKQVNILKQHGTIAGKSLESNFLLFDYCANSLDDLIEKNIDAIFDKSVIKCIMKQLFEGLEHIHSCNIVHRNISGRNILFHEAGILKITGFETARYHSKGDMTPEVTQLEYRAPELLFGAQKYDTPVDMWSAGCVFAKLLLKEFLFSGTSELEVLKSIFEVLGTPSETIWPGYNEMLLKFGDGNYCIEHEKPYADLKRYFVGQSVASKDMIQDLLLYYPSARLSAKECLKSFYFTEGPKECSIEELSLILQRIGASAEEPMNVVNN